MTDSVTSNQCPYCGREDGKHNEVCVYADNVRVRAELNDALEILALVLPGPRPWPTESIPSKLRIYREMALDKRRSSADETSPNPFRLRLAMLETTGPTNLPRLEISFQTLSDMQAASDWLRALGRETPRTSEELAQETTAPLTATEMATVARMAAVASQVQPEKASAPHVHIWIDDDGVAVCSDCKETADDWFCPTSPTKLCRYTRNHDACDFCGQPEERK